MKVKVRKFRGPKESCQAFDAFILWMIGRMPGECYERIALKCGKEDWLYHPSLQGEECPSNGEHPGIECRCDNCDTFLFCFPQYDRT